MAERADTTARGGTNRSVGAEAEAIASRYLVEQGLRPVARNVRSRGGEIDLVMRDGPTVVFVEVRYRNNARFGSASESVDGHKQRRIVQCAAYYLQQHPGLARCPARFDVVAIQSGGETNQLEWIQDAFQAY